MSSSFKYHIFSIYHSDPKFLEGYVFGSASLDQTDLPKRQSDQGQHCLPFCLLFLDVVSTSMSSVCRFFGEFT